MAPARRNQRNGVDKKKSETKLKNQCFKGEEWIRLLKEKSEEWDGKPLVVLSLFDGIGAIWSALTLIGIPFVGYSSEINPYAIQVVKERYPMVKHVGDVQNLKEEHISENVDLIVGGFPCQDLSSMGKKAGLHGKQSKLFFDLLRAVKTFRPNWFLVENVASMSWIDRDEISRYLGVFPMELDSQDLTPSRRRRLYWTNIPYPDALPRIRDDFSTNLQNFLENATALQTKTSCILSNTNSIGKSGNFQLVLNNNDGSLRTCNITELERLMGFAEGHTDFDMQAVEIENPNSLVPGTPKLNGKSPKTNGKSPVANGKSPIANGKSPVSVNGKSPVSVKSEKSNKPCDSEKSVPEEENSKKAIRRRMLGNSFSVKVIAYLLGSLVDASTRTNKAEYVLPYKNIEEQECSVMAVGDLWALYNGRGLPNWYGVIVKRSGGRFTKSNKNGKNGSVQIEVKFLDFTYDYAVQEADDLCPEHGTGRYKICRDTEVQNSWFSVSHRVKNYYKSQNSYFVYPGKNEVWAINHRLRAKCAPFFVFVTESSFSIKKKQLETTRPGKEGFSASCYALQQTAQPEVYRITDKLVEFDSLSNFAYSVPYIYKDQKGLLKIEYCSNRENSSAEGQGERTSKRRKLDLSDDDLSDVGEA